MVDVALLLFLSAASLLLAVVSTRQTEQVERRLRSRRTDGWRWWRGYPTETRILRVAMHVTFLIAVRAWLGWLVNREPEWPMTLAIGLGVGVVGLVVVCVRERRWR